MPVKPGSGVNADSPVAGSTNSVPAGLPVIGSITVIGPVDGSTPLTSVMLRGSPLGSVSLSSRFAVAVSPTGATARSSFACGSSFTDGSESAITLSVTVASSLAPLGSVIE